MLNRNMEVCVISPGLPIPPVEGGAIETFVYETVHLYQKSNTHVFSMQGNPVDLTRYNTKNVKYQQIKLSAGILRLQNFLDRIAKRGIFFLFHFFFIRKVVGMIDFKPDIFHLHNDFFIIPYLKQNFPDSKIVLHMHNECLFRYGYLYSQYVRILDKVDKIIICSYFTGTKTRNNYKEYSKKLIVVHNGVSLCKFKKLPDTDSGLIEWRERLNISPSTKSIIFVGRICEEKGVEYLIRAFKMLAANKEDVKLIIVGSSWFSGGRMTPYLKKMQDISKAVENRVVFTGFVPHDKLNYLFNLASICVVPSIWNEPFALVNLEAMAAECALIVTSVGGVPELVKNGETGILVSPKDKYSLCAAVNYLLENEDIRQKISDNEVRRVKEKFGWPKVANEIEDVYEQVFQVQ